MLSSAVLASEQFDREREHTYIVYTPKHLCTERRLLHLETGHVCYCLHSQTVMDKRSLLRLFRSPNNSAETEHICCCLHIQADMYKRKHLQLFPRPNSFVESEHNIICYYLHTHTVKYRKKASQFVPPSKQFCRDRGHIFSCLHIQTVMYSVKAFFCQSRV